VLEPVVRSIGSRETAGVGPFSSSNILYTGLHTHPVPESVSVINGLVFKSALPFGIATIKAHSFLQLQLPST
jgi:hypothetical protein